MPRPLTPDDTRKDAILRAVATAAERLFAADRWEDRVDDVLAALGSATEVDRCYVFRVEALDGEMYATQLHEWVADGVQPQIDNPQLQRAPFSGAGFQRWAELLRTGDIIHGDVADFPDSERELLQAQGVASLVVVPIITDGQWWGFMGFDVVGNSHNWEPAEADALRAAARAIGAAISREELVDELRASRAAYVEAFRRERDAVKRLEDLDRMKSTFIDAVSHELRTPLHNLIAIAETLKRYGDEFDVDVRDDLVARLARNGHRLHRIMRDLLDLNRLRQHRARVLPKQVDIEEFLPDVVTACEVVKGRKVEVDVEPARACFDPMIATQVLEQLLDNAVVHTGASTQIWVRGRSHAGGLMLTVEDDGPGIAPEDRERIFEAFEHGHLQRPHSPGTGIGLDLVARFAALHGGQARCVARPGGGSRFEITLPSPRREATSTVVDAVV